MSFTLSEIARQLDVEFVGDGNCVIDCVADIAKAESGSIAFISSGKYEKYLLTTKATAVIISEDIKDKCDIPCLVTDNPRLIYAKVAQLLYPSSIQSAEISSHSIVHSTVVMGDNISVEDGVVIKAMSSIASDVSIGAGSVIGENVVIGQGSKIYPNVTILDKCEIGENCILHSGVVIGADGFGFVPEDDHYVKVPQIGRVLIGDDVEIGANTTVDRGAIEDTVIGDGVKLDNQIQVAHNVVIGDHTVISAGTAIAGTTKIGKHCLIGGCVAIRDNIEITDNVILTGRTLVSRSITKSGSYSSSTPIDETGNWRKNSARFRTLDVLARRVKQLESLFKSDIDTDSTDKKL
jgi:UDP-3-O-[3-hydroxymyristoyl] glucosamine N-acyltransferase